MKKYIKNIIPLSEFGKNVIVLMTGTTIAQAIPIIITPILTRIYTPEDFGLLTIFMSLAVLFGNIVNGRYELAIMIPKEENEALEIARLSIFICFLVSIFLLLFVTLFSEFLNSMFGQSNLGGWIFLIPFAVFFNGLFNVLNYYNSRKKEFKLLASANIIKATSLGAVQVSFPFFYNGSFGLISGYFLSNFFGNIKLFKNSFISFENLFKTDFKTLKFYAIKYKEFPKYTLPAAISNSITTQFSNVLISYIYSVKILGFYSLGQRLLSSPINLISNSIGQVFFQSSTISFNQIGSARIELKQTIKKLFWISIPIFASIYFVVEPIFGYVFGKDWVIAGTYCKILVPLFFARFIVVPVSTLNVVYKKNKLGFIWQTGLLIIQFSIIAFAYVFHLEVEDFLNLFSIISAFYYFLLLFIIFDYTKEINDTKN